MLNLIVVSRDHKKRKEYIIDYCKKLSITGFDITTIDKDSITNQNLKSIGIADIKFIKKKIYLKPFKSKDKAVIIEDAELLTVEAQNALLKVLEEPPAHTIIILSASTTSHFLPTIISRCRIIDLKADKQELSEKESQELNGFLKNFKTMTIGDRLKLAEHLSKDKEKAISWIANLIILSRQNLLDYHFERTTTNSKEIEKSRSLIMLSQYYLILLKTFQELHTILKTTNTNPRLAIENALLQIH